MIPQLITHYSKLRQPPPQPIPPLYQLPTHQLIQIQVSRLECLVYLYNSVHLIVMRPVDDTLLTGWLLADLAEEGVLLLVELAKAC